MLYLLYRIGRFIVLTIPVKISYGIADIAGSVYYWLVKKDRNIINNNINVVLNQSKVTPEVRRTSRLVLVNFSRYLLEFFRTPRINLQYIEKYVRVKGRENLDQALNSGKGVLFVSAHLGNWELGAMVLSILGYKVNIVAWTHKNKLINDFFLQQRESKGLKIIPLGMGIRRTLSALKNNEAVAFLGDIDYINPDMGIRVKFFGRDTIMPKGPAAFSLKAGCPIIPVFMLREKTDRFRFMLGKPIIYQSTKDRQADLSALTQIITKRIESYIVRNPEQWFMLSPRW